MRGPSDEDPRAEVGGLELVWPGKYDGRGRRTQTPRKPATLHEWERFGDAPTVRIVEGDNLPVMDALVERARAEPSQRFDLIYLDPPFGTGGKFEVQRAIGDTEHQLRLPAYGDRFDGPAGLVAFLDPRLRRAHELLTEHGSLYVHVDPTVGHAVKLLLDEIFGPGCFQREIVWRIGWVSGFKTMAKNWIRNHDLIFFYVKNPDRFTFNKPMIPHPPGYRRRDGKPPKAAGTPVEDVWNASEADQGLTGRSSLNSIQITSFSREKTGWATQKNESLLARIIEASSNPGDLVGDFFAGSGTTATVATRLGRRVVSCDCSSIALQIARARLLELDPRPALVRERSEAMPRAAGPVESVSAAKLRLEHDGDRSRIGIEGYTLSRPSRSWPEGAPTSGLDLIEAWSVSPDQPQATVIWESHRARSRQLAERTPWLQGQGPWRIHLFDVMGNEFVSRLV